jgi:hypothetical protein
MNRLTCMVVLWFIAATQLTAQPEAHGSTVCKIPKTVFRAGCRSVQRPQNPVYGRNLDGRDRGSFTGKTSVARIALTKNW